MRWRPNTKEGHKKIEKSTAASKSKKAIFFEDEFPIIKIGRESKVFARFKVTDEQKALSFSIIGKKRELCLEAANKEEMYQFINTIKLVKGA